MKQIPFSACLALISTITFITWSFTKTWGLYSNTKRTMEIRPEVKMKNTLSSPAENLRNHDNTNNVSNIYRELQDVVNKINLNKDKIALTDLQNLTKSLLNIVSGNMTNTTVENSNDLKKTNDKKINGTLMTGKLIFYLFSS